MPQDERARNHAKRRATKRLAAHKAAAPKDGTAAATKRGKRKEA